MFKVFFFNDTATTEIYTLSLHDALPIFPHAALRRGTLPAWRIEGQRRGARVRSTRRPRRGNGFRSEEHTSELQLRQYLVCRLLLEKKKKTLHKATCRDLFVYITNMQH